MIHASARPPKFQTVDRRLRDEVLEAPIVRAAEYIVVQTLCTDD